MLILTFLQSFCTVYFLSYQAEVPEENQAETPGETNIPAAQEGPGLLKVILSFFVTFFTSLIPQQPAPVNAN